MLEDPKFLGMLVSTALLSSVVYEMPSLRHQITVTLGALGLVTFGWWY